MPDLLGWQLTAKFVSESAAPPSFVAGRATCDGKRVRQRSLVAAVANPSSVNVRLSFSRAV